VTAMGDGGGNGSVNVNVNVNANGINDNVNSQFRSFPHCRRYFQRALLF